MMDVLNDATKAPHYNGTYEDAITAKVGLLQLSMALSHTVCDKLRGRNASAGMNQGGLHASPSRYPGDVINLLCMVLRTLVQWTRDTVTPIDFSHGTIHDGHADELQFRDEN